MKRQSIILSTTAIFGLLLASCNKPPQAPHFIGGKHAGSGNSTPDDNETGSDLDGKGVDGYTNLVCDQSETHRGIRAWRRLSNVEISTPRKTSSALPTKSIRRRF